MDKIVEQVVAILAGTITLAIVAVLVSRQADTARVISAGGSAFSKIIGAAVAPVAGSSSNAFGTAPQSLGSLFSGG